MFCDASHTNWGNSLHGEPQKENSNWCDRSGVRVRNVMKWHSLYQSVSHSVTAVVPEYWLPLRPAPLHTAVALPLGKSHSFPPFSRLFRSPPLLHRLLSQLYKLSLFSLLFPQIQLRLSGEGGKEGSMLRGVEFFLSFLAPMAIRHKALCPFLHAFFFFSLSLPSSTSLLKATLAVFPANLLLSHQPKIPLECLCWSSGSGRASLRTQTVKETGFRWRRRKNKPKGTLAGVGQCVCLPSVHVCADEKDKIRLWLGRTQMIRDFCDFPSNPNRSYFPRKTSRFPTSLPNPDFALNPPSIFLSHRLSPPPP